MTASPEFKARMASVGPNVSPDVCGVKLLAKVNEESESWARIVKATGFVADN